MDTETRYLKALHLLQICSRIFSADKAASSQREIVGFRSLFSLDPPPSRNAMVNENIDKRTNICLHDCGIKLTP